jgi:hypothetical protein
VVYIWRFQSAIEFQSVNQTIPSACVPQKMSCVMRPANTARTLREHCANTARTARAPHSARKNEENVENRAAGMGFLAAFTEFRQKTWEHGYILL